MSECSARTPRLDAEMHLCLGGMGDRVAAELNVRTAQGKRSEEMVDHFRGPGGGGLEYQRTFL